MSLMVIIMILMALNLVISTAGLGLLWAYVKSQLEKLGDN